jgi:phosphatidate cytidylyltransferase
VILNTYEGLIWMVFPSMLVVTNDIFAYIFGKLFGKT